MQTLNDMIQWASQTLRPCMAESPQATVEAICMHVCGVPRHALYLALSSSLSDMSKQAIFNMVMRRKHHEPLQYILGYTHFHDITLSVDPRVLIPRPETVCLCDCVIMFLGDNYQHKSFSVLDIGVGSGAIAIVLARHFRHADVCGMDISQEALAVARENVSLLKLSERIRLVHGDVGKGISGQWDMIVSNPPYIVSRECADLPQDVLSEPMVALDGGVDGLAIYRKIFLQGRRALKEGGYMVLEIHAKKAQDVMALARDYGWGKARVFLDDCGRNRVIVLQKETAGAGFMPEYG